MAVAGEFWILEVGIMFLQSGIIGTGTLPVIIYTNHYARSLMWIAYPNSMISVVGVDSVLESLFITPASEESSCKPLTINQ